MTPPSSGRDKRTPQVVIAQRIAAIATLLVRGSTTAEVRRVVAKAQGEEADERRKAYADASRKNPALKGGALDTLAESRVPLVWGDDPIPDRTVDRYIKAAKEKLSDDGLGCIENLEQEIGLQYSRGLALFHAAFRDKRYHAAHQAWQGLNELLGAKDAAKLIRPDLSAELGTGEGAPLVRVEPTGPAIPAERRAALGLVKPA